jgi:hypothetical protein
MSSLPSGLTARAVMAVFDGEYRQVVLAGWLGIAYP